MWSNCLIFAIRLWWRRQMKGRRVYISLRKSHWGRFPHFVVFERRPYGWKLVSYVPLDPRRKVSPPPLFRGRVKWGDDA